MFQCSEIVQQVTVLNQDMDLKGKCVVFPIGDGQPKKTKEPTETWRRPPACWSKLNVDASFSKEHNRGSWGAVLRDHESKVLMSAWGVIPYCQSAEGEKRLHVLKV